MTQRQKSHSLVRFFCEESTQIGFEFRLVLVQFLIVLLVAFLSGLFSGLIAAAVLLGGLISVAGNAWLAFVVSCVPLGASPEKILAAFYRGEIGKWLITAMSFLVIFKKFLWFRQWPEVGFLFAGFAIAQSLNWIYPALCRKRAQAKQP